MLNILTAGLPLSSIDILMEASKQAFGEGVAEVIILDKDSLRSRVRLSQRNVQDALVILDNVSKDLCKDIENGLYSMDKFYTYSDDEDLVDFLNNKYGLSIEIQTNSMEISPSLDNSVSAELVEKYEVQLADKDMLIANLNARILELNNTIELGGYIEEPVANSEQYDKLVKDYASLNADFEGIKKENLDLHNQLLNETSRGKAISEELTQLTKERDELKISLEKLEEKRESILADLKSVSGELTDYKVKYSMQTGLLKTKQEEIENLKKQVESSKSNSTLLEGYEEEKKTLLKQIDDLKLESSKYLVDLESKSSEILRLKTELQLGSETTEKVEALKNEVSSLSEEKNNALKRVSELQNQYDNVLQNYENMVNEYDSKDDSLNEELNSLREKLEVADKNLIDLNKERLEMQGRLMILEKSTDRNVDIEDLVSELSNLRERYQKLSTNVFSKISSFALPKGSTSVNLTRKGVQLSNIRFVFAGSTESRKGSYKCLLEEFKQLPKTEKVLVVDVVSETSIDYVFEITKVVPGIDWFRKGGGVQPYLSNTCLDNVRVLSPGLGYINDSYFLTVDWEQRLTELENSGYMVVLYCGDISNIVGRVLHESFADLGMSMVYVHGNAIGTRTIVTNLRGLSNSKSSIICYYDFNTRMKRFYDIVVATNECRVLSMLGGNNAET